MWCWEGRGSIAVPPALAHEERPHCQGMVLASCRREVGALR